ncbi:MAG TPA: FecR family protein, partial [Blastocatellia bacterium]|nr:FecR family protein [Blastocatellia bacterium]
MNRKQSLLTITTLFILAISAVAQDRKPLPPGEQQKYVVSAKPGIVSLIEGELNSRHENTGWARLFETEQPDWKKLNVGDQLEINDRLRSNTAGRAEVLLTPGVYLRLSGNSEVVFQFDGDARQELTLERGSIIVEASLDSWITVNALKSTVYLIRTGVYRIDLNGEQLAVAAREGKAFVGDTEIKQGRKVTFSSESPLVGKLDRNSDDAFDVWSKDRARSLIALNRSLNRNQLRSSGLITNVINTWIFDRFCGCYTFLPWTGGFASPYGWGYSVCNPYWYWNGNPSGGWYSGGWPTGGGGGGHPGGGHHGG